MENDIQPNRPNVIFTFGRFNPPTTGHEMIIDKMIQEAKDSKADAYVILSHSQNAVKNPLFVEEKLNMMANIFPNKDKIRKLRTYPPRNGKQRSIGDILREFCEKYDNVTMVVGSDRVNDFTWLRDGHLKKNGTRGASICPKLVIKSAGERNATKNNISGMSASKVREAALADKWKEVRAGIPSAITNAKVDEVFSLIRSRIQPTKKRARNAPVNHVEPPTKRPSSPTPTPSGGRRRRQTRRRS